MQTAPIKGRRASENQNCTGTNPDSTARPLEQCKNCGKSLADNRKLNQFCDYACRGQWRVARIEKTCARKSKRNRALHTLKRLSVGRLGFVQINGCTVRVDTRNKQGVAWLIEVIWPGNRRRRWIARVGSRGSAPLPFEATKQAPIDLLTDRAPGTSCEGWACKLNRIAATEVDLETKVTLAEVCAVEQRDSPPVHRRPISPEALHGDDFPLEFHVDGFPKLPEFLRRRRRDG